MRKMCEMIEILTLAVAMIVHVFVTVKETVSASLVFLSENG